MSNTFVFLIPILVVGIGYLMASSTKGGVRKTRIGSRCLELQTAADPKTVFARIKTIGPPYSVDDADEISTTIILSTGVTFGTWGFLYPVVITPNASGGSRIQIGIDSKLVQWGPLVTKWHKKCHEAIEQLIGVPTARVAG